MLGLPGLGKSSLLRRMALGLAGFGVMPLVLGDLKPDYVDLIERAGRAGDPARPRPRVPERPRPRRGRSAAARLTGKARGEVLADALARRHTMVATLITLARGGRPATARR